MKKSLPLSIALALTISLAASARPPVTGQASRVAASCPSDVPAAIVPAADQRLVSMRDALGVQIYVCNATPAGAYAWQFIAPQANLFNDAGDVTGTHFIGPVWQDNDGSSIKGAKVAGSTVSSASIPWLLLKVVSHSGEGKLDRITSIQRLSTEGGNAPDASTCTAATVGTLAQVPYTAQYFFYDTHVTNDSNLQCR